MNDKTTGRAHWSFWAIGVVTLLYNLAGVLNFSTQMNAETVAAMPASYRTIVESRPAWATGAFAVAVCGGALGCLLLLLRKSIAFHLFVASLVAAAVTLVQTLGLTGSDANPIEFALGNLVQIGVTAFLIWYSKLAEGRGWIG